MDIEGWWIERVGGYRGLVDIEGWWIERVGG